MKINGKDFIKVFIPFSDPDMPGCRGESPWAELVETLPSGNIRARIDNHLVTDIHGFKLDDIVEFSIQDERWQPVPHVIH